MKALKLINGDIVFERGRPVMVEGIECLAQRLKNAIKLDRRSWFLDIDKGIEWLDIFEDKPVPRRVIHSRISSVLKNDPEVLSTNYIDLVVDRPERTLKIIFSVNSIYGEVKEEEWITE